MIQKRSTVLDRHITLRYIRDDKSLHSALYATYQGVNSYSKCLIEKEAVKYLSFNDIVKYEINDIELWHFNNPSKEIISTSYESACEWLLYLQERDCSSEAVQTIAKQFVTIELVGFAIYGIVQGIGCGISCSLLAIDNTVTYLHDHFD